MADKSKKEDFHSAGKNNAWHILRKLQQHSRANIPAMMAQRSMSTFTLQQEPYPDEASSTVFVTVYPQNPFVGEPEIRRMLAREIQSGLINSRVQVQDSRGIVVEPDAEGHYLYWPGTPQFDQMNAFYYTTYTLRMFERYAHRTLPWAFPTARITIDPHAGDSGNAFYNEQARLLGFHTFKDSEGEEHATAQSADIVAHEAAHAVLDGIRDLYNESFGLGGRAFHESFGDIAAMLVALHDDSLIRRLLSWTNGDLRMTNFISEVAENLTKELKDNAHYQEHTIYLRNAFNFLRAKPFDELPYQPNNPETELAREEHNYSRLFTGAVYDILVGIYEHHKKEHKQPNFVALLRARDILGSMLIMAIELGPVGELYFEDMARAFLTADGILFEGAYQAILREVFDKRAILLANDSDEHLKTLAALPDVRLPEIMTNALAAAIFLENEVLSALKITPQHELLPMSTYRNAEGYAFMTFFASQTVKLEGEQFGILQNTQVDVFGGLTLLFDRDDRLRSAVYRPVNDTDIKQIHITITDMLQHNKVVNDLFPPGTKIKRIISINRGK
ncbi:MAG: hypothetical protein Q9P44_17400, partial [Anaerolineae bacterium]|nr:hypothetical protein [Anaerolineae bacterium]